MAVLVVAFMSWQTYTATHAAETKLDAEINRSGVEVTAAISLLVRHGWTEDRPELEKRLKEIRELPGLGQVLDIIAYGAQHQALATASGKDQFGRTEGRQISDPGAADAATQITEFVYDGEPVRAFSRSIGSGSIEVYVSAAEIERSRSELSTAMARVSLTACLVAAGAAFLLARFLTGPIRALVRDMRQVSLGHLDHQSKVRTKDELGSLAHAFNLMTTELKSAQELKLEQRARDHELSLATQIQSRLLPSDIPEISGFDVAHHYAPAREIGGDYFDFLRIDEERVGVAVADVSGKGVPAALIMALTRSLLLMAARGETSPARTLEKVNRFLTPDLSAGMFVTMAYFVIDEATREARLVRAGHNPPLYFSAAASKVIELRPRGLGVGIDREGSRFVSELQVQKLTFHPGDVLVTYTDGIVEGKDRNGADYSDERLREVLAAHAALGARAIAQAIVDDLHRHTRGAETSDDITLIVLKAR